MSDSSPTQEELLAELSALQADNRARKLRTAWALQVGSLVVASSFVFLLRGDIRFALQPKTPIELGGPLEFTLGAERSDAFAHLSGVPAPQAANVSRAGTALRVFGLLGSNVLVVQERSANPDDAPSSGAPFSATGRLLRDDDAVEFSGIFAMMEAAGDVSRQDRHLYALYLGEAPRKGLELPAELLGIVLFVLVNWRAAWGMRRSAEPLDLSAEP